MKMFWKSVKHFFTLKIYLWLVLLGVVGFIGFYLYGFRNGVIQFEGNSSSSSTVQYIEKVNEVVFLNAGINKVESKETTSGFIWSKKSVLLVLNYKAKFGIKSPVSVEEKGDHEYIVSVPKFEVIGIELDDDEPYQLYDKSGELLSFTAEDIDTGEVVAEALSKERQEEFLDTYTDQIKESAENYYTTLLTSVDSEAKITLEFASDN